MFPRLTMSGTVSELKETTRQGKYLSITFTLSWKEIRYKDDGTPSTEAYNHKCEVNGLLQSKNIENFRHSVKEGQELFIEAKLLKRPYEKDGQQREFSIAKVLFWAVVPQFEQSEDEVPFI